jgi:hypothetical protein
MATALDHGGGPASGGSLTRPPPTRHDRNQEKLEQTSRSALPTNESKINKRDQDQPPIRSTDRSLVSGVTSVIQTSETGEVFTSLFAASARTGVNEATRRWEQLYVLRIARFLGQTLTAISYAAHRAGVAVPYFSEFYASTRTAISISSEGRPGLSTTTSPEISAFGL